MATRSSTDALDSNKNYYETFYSKVDCNELLDRCRRYEHLIAHSKRTMPEGYFHLYYDDLERRLAGRKVLELGFGTGLNSLLLAKFGASVVSVEIADSSVSLLTNAAEKYGVLDRVHAVAGDFLQLAFEAQSFDYVIGKAFLHHLTNEQEDQYVRKAAHLLKADGEARFTEPAMNIPLFDKLRFWIPVSNRPSKFRRRAFNEWKSSTDRHPDRDNSSVHYQRTGQKYFSEVVIRPWDGVSRMLNYFSPHSSYFWNIRNFLIDVDDRLPKSIQYRIARFQTIQFLRPKEGIHHAGSLDEDCTVRRV